MGSKTRNRNDLQYIGSQPNSLEFNDLSRVTSLFPFRVGDPAVRSLSTPTLGSFSSPFPLFATADAAYDYYGTLTNTNGGSTPPNNTAQINDRSIAANQVALDEAVANGSLPGSLIGKQRDLFTASAVLGYNYQYNSIVVGIEADFSYLGRNPDASFAAGAPVVIGVNPIPISIGGGDYITSNALIEGEGNSEARWLATVRGRFGFAFDRALVYATGGLAFGRVKSSATIAVSDSFLGVPTVDAVWSGSYSKTRVGWALGAGFQYAISENWSLKAEYLHYDLGKHSYTLNSVNPDNVLPYDSGDYAMTVRARARTSGDIVRVGLNYRFGG
jgi:outer membrane immunogenic protein